MYRHKTPWMLLLLVSTFLFTLPNAALAATVKVEALGFFSHPPMQETRDTITKVCQEFGSQVDLSLHDEWTPDGENFMQEKGLSGHLPMVLYINGSVAHKIGDRVVVFRDFVGSGWTAQDLEQVIKLNLAGQKTAVAAPHNATTEAWNPGAIPSGAGAFNSGSGPTAGGSSPGRIPGLPLYIVGGIVALLAVFLIIWKLRKKR